MTPSTPLLWMFVYVKKRKEIEFGGKNRVSFLWRRRGEENASWGGFRIFARSRACKNAKISNRNFPARQSFEQAHWYSLELSRSFSG